MAGEDKQKSPGQKSAEQKSAGQKSSWLEPLPEEFASDDGATSRRMIVAAMTVVVLAIFGGVIWYSYMGKTTGGPVPGGRADKSVIKVKPQDPGGMEVPNQDKLVYKKVSDAAIEDQEDRLAPSAEIPLGRPEAQAGSAAGEAEKTENAGVPENAGVNGDADAVRKADLPPAPPGTTTPEVADKSQKSPEKVVPAAAAIQTTSVASSPVATDGIFMVQMGAFSKRASAENLWKTLRQKHADVLGGLKPDYMIVDLGQKGTLYRLRGGMIKDRASADKICATLKARGQSCLVVKK